MVVLPPGTLLQLMYLRERLGLLRPGRFIEIGPGSGEITQMLLNMGWTGRSYDLEVVTIERLYLRFAREIGQGRYTAVNADYLSQPLQSGSADLVISCMVMEHLEDASEFAFMRKSSEILSGGGLMIGLVPDSPAHWGIEDDIAGHCRRYNRDKIQGLMEQTGWAVGHLAGLTFPVSNVLLPISNYLVNRSEKWKLVLSAIERTKFSGRRNVKFKTNFPSLLGLVLNRCVLWPLHFLQKIFKNSDSALVIYFEAWQISRAGHS
uniref:class I SAM-dependent methyltransferase n=1 Tax=Polynucleobacter sp. TaxID=2029855 RepID=UPI004048BC94